LSVATAAEFTTLEIAFAFGLVVAVRAIIQIIENGFTVSGRCDMPEARMRTAGITSSTAQHIRFISDLEGGASLEGGGTSG